MSEALFPDPESFLDSVEAVARAGAKRLMPFWRSLEADQVTEKARNDLVSAADHAAEEAILSEIHRRFPDHEILSEEAGWSEGSSDGPTWVVDPLDGTTNFVHGIAQFAVSVGVSADDRVRFGVILDPIKGDVFRAARGCGVWWNGARCTVSSRPDLRGALLATGFPFRAHRLLEPYLAIFRDLFLRCKAIRRPGAAALDLAYTACGIFDGFFEFRLSPWDIAAGSLMVEEAGGVVTDMDGGSDYLSSGNVLCGPAGIHRELLEVAQQHRDAWGAIADTEGS
jgi:myo-inositol-1(or 4)-monophosphatase